MSSKAFRWQLWRWFYKNVLKSFASGLIHLHTSLYCYLPSQEIKEIACLKGIKVIFSSIICQNIIARILRNFIFRSCNCDLIARNNYRPAVYCYKWRNVACAANVTQSSDETQVNCVPLLNFVPNYTFVYSNVSGTLNVCSLCQLQQSTNCFVDPNVYVVTYIDEIESSCKERNFWK